MIMSQPNYIAKLSLNSTQLNFNSKAEVSFILKQIQPPTHPTGLVEKGDLSVNFNFNFNSNKG